MTDMTDLIARQGRAQAELDDSTQFATIYDGFGLKPVATLQRRRVYAPEGEPRWRLFALDGRELRQFYAARSYQSLLDRCEHILEREGIIKAA